MRKALTVVLALIMSAGMLCGSLAEGESATDRICTDWITLLMMQDDRYTQENYTLQAVIDYCENPSWENLVRARAAVAHTCRVVKHYAYTEAQQFATDEDYTELYMNGSDVAAIRTEFHIYNNNTLVGIQDLDLFEWNNYYKSSLMTLAFDKYSLDHMASKARVRQQYNIYTMKYLNIINQYIAFELPSEDSERFNALAAINAPGVMSMYDRTFETVTEMDIEMNHLLDRYTELELELIRVNNMLTVDVGAEQERMTDGSYMFLPEECIQIEHQPTTLPWGSSWEGSEMEFSYFWKDADGVVTPLSNRMVMDTIPNCMTATVPNITLSDYNDYIDRLSRYGIDPDNQNNATASYSFEDGTSLVISWNADELEIAVRNGQLFFSPRWYIDIIKQQ